MGFSLARVSRGQQGTSLYSVSSSDLTAAGYSVIKQETPTANRFGGPAVYFRTNEHVSGEPGNIVMVDIGPNNPSLGFYTYPGSNDFNIAGATTAKEAKLSDGATVINFVKGSTYVTIIGPDQAKTEALATAVSNRI